MDLTLTSDQQLIADTAREVLAGHAGRADARAVADEPDGYSAELWGQLVELGWTGMAFDESYGGVGLGLPELCLLLEQLGAAQMPTPLLTSSACSGLTIARFGTEPQKADWLGAIAGGRVVGYARAAPGGRWGSSGSDVTATDTGDGFTVDGTAFFVPYAAAAATLLVVAQTGGADALTVLLVDTDTPGMVCQQLDTVGADRLYRVDFEGVSVPADRVLGAAGTGRDVVEAATAYGTVATCAQMAGGAQGVLDMTVEYATQRQQFGKPIGSFQAVQHQCADMAIDVLSSRLMAYEAAWRLSAGLDAPREISAAKAWISEAYQRVCSHGHQVHGAIGFTAEHDLHQYLRHAVGAAVAFGDGDFHTDRLAHSLVG